MLAREDYATWLSADCSYAFALVRPFAGASMRVERDVDPSAGSAHG